MLVPDLVRNDEDSKMLLDEERVLGIDLVGTVMDSVLLHNSDTVSIVSDWG